MYDVTFKINLETIKHYYPQYILCVYKDGISKFYEGYRWQFDFEDGVKFYEDAPVGQDYPRTKGNLIKYINKNLINSFEQIEPSYEEYNNYTRLLNLYSDFLNRKISRENYIIALKEFKSLNIDLSNFKL